MRALSSQRCNKITFFFIIFSLFFICILLFTLPVIVTVNFTGVKTLAITGFINNELISTTVSFINTQGPVLVGVWNSFTPVFNSISTILPVIFTVWNEICRAVETLINIIVTTYCPTGILDCLAGGLSTAVTDFLTLLMELFEIFGGLLDSIRVALESIICDAGLASIINYTIPLSCSSPPLPVSDISNWFSSILTYIFVGGGSTVTKTIVDVFCDWTGECGLKATAANVLPHEFPVAVPEVTNLFQLVSRVNTRPAILKNGAIGFFWNIIALPADSAICTLKPANFIPCIFEIVCTVIFVPVTLFSIPALDVTVGQITFPIIPETPIVVDLGFLICPLLTGGVCPCFRCTNIVGLKGPCVITGASGAVPACSTCDSYNTLLKTFGTTVSLPQLSPDLLLSPVTMTPFPSGIQNQGFF